MTHDTQPPPAWQGALDELSQTGTWVETLGPEGESVWSPGMTLILGPLTPDERPSNQALLSRLHPEDQPGMVAALHAARTATSDVHQRARVPREPGTELTIEVSARAARDHRGAVTHLLGVIKDVTRHRVATHDAQAEVAQLHRAQALSGVGSWRRDLVSGHATWTHQMQTVLGLKQGSPTSTTRVSTDHFDRLVHPDDQASLRAAREVAEERRNMPADAWEGRVVRPDGTVRHVELNTTVVEGPDGPIELGTIQDVTERVERHAQICRAERMQAVATLAGRVGEEIDGHLMVILGNASLLSTTKRPELHDIVAEAEAAQRLARSLLAFGRDRPEDEGESDVDAAVIAAADAARDLAPDNVTVSVELAAARRVGVPFEALRDAVLALARNAVEASAMGGRVLIRSGLHEDAEDTAWIAVEDSGPGMASHVLARATEPFYTTKGWAAAGLGLARVYATSQRAGGDLEITSRPGAGTRAVLRMPTARARKRSLAQGNADLAGRRVLVLEDDPAVRRIVVSVLERVGYDVYVGAEPSEILTIADRIRVFDLFLADAITPGGGGPTAVRRLREAGFRFRHLFMTGYSPAGIDLDGPVLAKPFRPATLLREVERLLTDP